MKKSDFAMVIMAASISVVVSFLIARVIFGDFYNESTKVKTFEKISSEVVEPNSEIFNRDAINPTVQVQITGKD